MRMRRGSVSLAAELRSDSAKAGAFAIPLADAELALDILWEGYQGSNGGQRYVVVTEQSDIEQSC